MWLVLCGCFNMAAWVRLCCMHTWVVLCGCLSMAAWVRLSNKSHVGGVVWVL